MTSNSTNAEVRIVGKIHAATARPSLDGSVSTVQCRQHWTSSGGEQRLCHGWQDTTLSLARAHTLFLSLSHTLSFCRSLSHTYAHTHTVCAACSPTPLAPPTEACSPTPPATAPFFRPSGAYMRNFLSVFVASRVRGPERRAGAPETRGEA